MKKIVVRNVSLSRALSKLGYCSRTQAVKLIVGGHVYVNGTQIKHLSWRCALNLDKITIDGQLVSKEVFIYIKMNKPVGVVTTRSDECGKPTVYDVLGDVGQWVFPVGRLDKDTSGLLIFTNDNQLGERLTNPKTKIPKTYMVGLDKQPTRQDLDILRKGMNINSERFLPAKVTILDEKEIEITVFEGKNRQIRRMFESFGYKVVSLRRTKIGDIELTGLKPGEWKYLSKRDLLQLKTIIKT